MNYKKLIIGAIAALVMSAGAIAQTNQATVPIAQTTVKDGIWRFSLSGRATVDVATPATANNSKTYGGEIEFSRALKIGLPGEIGIRQDIGYSMTTVNQVSTVTVPVPVPPCCSADGSTTTKNVVKSFNKTGVQFETKAFYDWQLFKIGNFAVDSGVNAGVLYGNQTLDFQVSPEVDARLFLFKNVNTFVRGEYPWDVNTGEFTGGLVITAGLQWRF